MALPLTPLWSFRRSPDPCRDDPHESCIFAINYQKLIARLYIPNTLLTD